MSFNTVTSIPECRQYQRYLLVTPLTSLPIPAMRSRSPSHPGSPPSEALQPFQCLVCQKRFTRHENLKRHAALHAQRERDITFPCSYCSTVFSRRDLRRRHIKRKHPDVPLSGLTEDSAREERHIDQPAQSSSGDNVELKTVAGPSGTAALSSVNDFTNLFGDRVLESLHNGPLSIEEILSGSDTRYDTIDHVEAAFPDASGITNGFPPPLSALDFTTFTRPQLPVYSPPSFDRPLPSPQETTIGIQLFFDNVAHCFPFIHRPTFDSSRTPEPLLMGILSLGLQYLDDHTRGSGLAKSCFHRGRELLETDHLRDRIASDLQIHAIQACLMLEMHAIMLTCGSETAYGLRMHTRCVELARAGGLAEPLPSVSTASDLDSLWHQFVRVETHKRTWYTLYQCDVMWYHILSIPRIISHLEIKLELPCSQDMWTAQTSSEWAHRSLTTDKSSGAPTRYIQAVRTFMSPNPPPCTATYDAHASLLIILFLLSSVREQSGWSTMTGRVSFERFEALHSSLRALEGLMNLSSDGKMSIVCEATWHMSMIELLLWSTPHTNGVVEGSLDAALAAGTHLTVAQPIVMSGQVVESLEGHLRFFLSYLDRTTKQDAMSESPWVTIYCFKAALITWQLIRAGIGDVAFCIGISDLGSMFEWIKNVFAIRSRWGVGRAVLKSLDELEAVSTGL